jgi:hypothetical protein
LDAAPSCENLVWVFLSFWWFSFSRFLCYPFSLLTIKFANVVRCKQKFCSFCSEEIDEGEQKTKKNKKDLEMLWIRLKQQQQQQQRKL